MWRRLFINYCKGGVAAGCDARRIVGVAVDCKGHPCRDKTTYDVGRREEARLIDGLLGWGGSHRCRIGFGVDFHDYVGDTHGINHIVDVTSVPRLVLYAGREGGGVEAYFVKVSEYVKAAKTTPACVNRSANI